jgi:hypothetical protein
MIKEEGSAWYLGVLTAYTDSNGTVTRPVYPLGGGGLAWWQTPVWIIMFVSVILACCCGLGLGRAGFISYPCCPNCGRPPTKAGQGYNQFSCQDPHTGDMADGGEGRQRINSGLFAAMEAGADSDPPAAADSTTHPAAAYEGWPTVQAQRTPTRGGGDASELTDASSFQ